MNRMLNTIFKLNENCRFVGLCMENIFFCSLYNAIDGFGYMQNIAKSKEYKRQCEGFGNLLLIKFVKIKVSLYDKVLRGFFVFVKLTAI